MMNPTIEVKGERGRPASRGCRLAAVMARWAAMLVWSGLLFVPAAAQAAPEGEARMRSIEVNGRPLDAAGMRTLALIESRYGPAPPGRYWYDPVSGGGGPWGGPATVYLGPGLNLNGPVPANASGGGDGRLTGVFINGRELHPLDVQGLSVLGPVQRGRFWWDGYGNVGPEGGPFWFNFYQAMAVKHGGSASTYVDHGKGKTTFVGKGCVTMHGKTGGTDFSYYGGCG